MDKYTVLNRPTHQSCKIDYIRIGLLLLLCFIGYTVWSVIIDESIEVNEPFPQTKRSTFQRKLVCYFTAPSDLKNDLTTDRIDAFLCTHINIGVATIEDNRIVIDGNLNETFKQIQSLKQKNLKLKILIWIGGPSNSIGIIQMIHRHGSRQKFIKSVLSVLETYQLDGIDFDWEFPSSDSKIHFSQLLYEIRRAFTDKYLLSLAVAAPEGIAYFAYNFNILNQYCDYINIMTYDFHFYSTSSPFTGLNAPLYRRSNEQSVLATLNINASVSFWNQTGLDRSKIIVGIPTYGHSFRLVNPFNNKIGSPADGFGHTGNMGFVTYADVCKFDRHHIFATKVFDSVTCSPYISAGFEWISYEDKRSVKCKTNYVIEGDFGGVMIFSLNTDDYLSSCYYGVENGHEHNDHTFPLTSAIRDLLFTKN